MTGTLAGTLMQHLRRMAAPSEARGLTDAQLLQCFAAQGEETAFAALLHRHGRLVWSVCRRVLANEQDAEDVFQAAFLVLARRAPSIRKGESVASWLYGVAYRIAMKANKKLSNRQKYEARAKPRPGQGPTAELMCRELQALLDEELLQLPEKYRAPFILCILEGKDRKEAAEQLGWKEGTLSGRLAAARRLLQQRLGRRGVSLAVALAAAALSETATAAVPLRPLMESTLQLARGWAAGDATALSPSIAELAQGVGQGMLWNKVKSSVILILLVGLTGLAIAAPHAADPPAPSPQPARAPSAQQPPAGARKEAANDIRVRGRVLGPDGHPFEGANVYLWAGPGRASKDVRAHATTGADGRFQVSIRRDDRRSQAKIVATAPNHGPDWVQLSEHKPGDELTLRLVKDDVPIQGRILDLQGKPVANATVRLLMLHQTSLDWWLKEMKRGRWYYPRPIDPEALDTPTQVATGADGRFRMRGLGRERLAYVMISGQTIERVRCWVMTRARTMPDLPQSGEAVYSAVFDHIAGPTKPIIGTVREKGTGKPLAGVTVQMAPGWLWINNATTDERGRYRIVGAPKQHDYSVAVAGAPYFAVTKQNIADTPGFDPITVDFELQRGAEIRGRVINKTTGAPVAGSITYRALADNPHLQNASELDQGYAADRRNHVESDGSFFVVGLPGRGVLTLLADEDDYLKPERPADWEKLVPSVNLAPPRVHAWVPIDIPEKAKNPTRVEIKLEPARPIPGEVLGPDGKPLGGYFVAGLTGSPVFHSYQIELHADPSFRVRGCDPAHPRTLVFLHPEKKLGRVQVVRGDEHGPLRIRLQPLSAATGRILSSDGRPQADLRVRAQPSRKDVDDNLLPTLFQLEQGLQANRLDPQGTTDAGGRFRLDGLVPGLEYTLEVSDGLGRSRMTLMIPLESWRAASGQTKDLGDLRSKR
jgi:RNA polymerase sigma factor (sigma-70 family)